MFQAQWHPRSSRVGYGRLAHPLPCHLAHRKTDRHRVRIGRLRTEQKRSSIVLSGGVGVPVVPAKNERAELEMEMMKYRQLAGRMVDEEFVRRAKEKVAELKKKLREVDE